VESLAEVASARGIEGRKRGKGAKEERGREACEESGERERERRERAERESGERERRERAERESGERERRERKRNGGLVEQCSVSTFGVENGTIQSPLRKGRVCLDLPRKERDRRVGQHVSSARFNDKRHRQRAERPRYLGKLLRLAAKCRLSTRDEFTDTGANGTGR